MTTAQTNWQQPESDDIKHLNLLALFHYVAGALLALLGCCPMIHLVLGFAMFAGVLPGDGQQNQPGRHNRSGQYDSQTPQFQQPQGQPNQQGQTLDTNGVPGQARTNGNWPEQPQQMQPPARRSNADRNAEMAVGVFFVVIALASILMMWTVALMVVLAGRNLKRRKAYTFCLVIAAIECLFMPFGTLLGVFTLVVLTRPSVKVLFAVSSNPSTNDLPSADTGSSDVKQWP